VLAVAALVAVLATAWIVPRVRAAQVPAEELLRHRATATGEPLPVLFRGPDFLGSGAPSLAGHVWIVNFIYTSCTTVCPKMTGRLAQLQRRLPREKAQNVRFVSLSVDPAHDTPATLAAFAAHWPADPRWQLRAPPADELTAIARGFRVAVAPSGIATDPILHSRLLTLVDGAGNVRAIYDGDDEQAWGWLATDAEALLAELPKDLPETGNPATQLPKNLLADLGCNGCHDRPTIAPPLGRRGVDDSYLRASLLTPNASVVAGYVPMMPSYRATLTDDDVTAVIAALHALPAPPERAPSAQANTAEDPICHMTVGTHDPALTLRDGDHDVHFCSRACRDTFARRK
jgi:protein SCO1/2